MPRRTIVSPEFAVRFRDLLDERGVSFRALSARTYYSKTYLHDVASSKKAPSVDLARRLDDVMDAGGKLVALVSISDTRDTSDDELNALELARRATASDVGEETLARLELEHRSSNPESLSFTVAGGTCTGSWGAASLGASTATYMYCHAPVLACVRAGLEDRRRPTSPTTSGIETARGAT